MKRYIFLLVFAASATLAMAVAKKPTIMVVPSDVWCNTNGYVIEVDNQGAKTIVPDYQTALANDIDLKLAISKINDLMKERDFPAKDLEQTLKNITQSTAEANLTMSKNGNELAETLLDRLLRTAKADIILELTWNVKVSGPKRTLTYILEGKDAYTGKSIGSATGTSQPSLSADVTVLLEEAVVAHIDNFNNRLQAHFDDMFELGREVVLEIRVFQDNEAGIDLESEFDGVELIEIIDDWLSENTVGHRFSKMASSETYAQYEQVRIPLENAKGQALDTEGFARQLRNVLRKEPYNIPVKMMNRGLGRAVLILGEK